MEKFFSEKVKCVCVCNLCSCFCHSIGVCVYKTAVQCRIDCRAERIPFSSLDSAKCEMQCQDESFVSRTEKSDVLARRFSRSSTAETVTAAKVSTLSLIESSARELFFGNEQRKKCFQFKLTFFTIDCQMLSS